VGRSFSARADVTAKTRPVLENITNKWSILILTFIALYEWALEHGAEMERAQEVYDSSRVKEI
jgi:hypothetical protein